MANPVANDDFASFSENDTISGNLLSNDVGGTNGNKFLRFFDGESVLAKKAGQVTDIEGEFGTFHVKADGSYTYTLHEDAKVNFTNGETLSEKITYKISDGLGNTDVAVLHLDIHGVTSGPVAVNDEYTFGENDSISGNVLDNDKPGEYTGNVFFRSVEGTNIAKNGVTNIDGEYGTFHFKSDGSFTYDLDQSVKDSLGAGQSVTEELRYYKISDGLGHTDPAKLTLHIDGDGLLS